MNITLFSCDNDEDPMNSYVDVFIPTITYENQHGNVLNYRDPCGQDGKIGNIFLYWYDEERNDACKCSKLQGVVWSGWKDWQYFLCWYDGERNDAVGEPHK